MALFCIDLTNFKVYDRSVVANSLLKDRLYGIIANTILPGEVQIPNNELDTTQHLSLN